MIIKNIFKKSLAAASVVASLSAVTSVEAANWLMLQGTEPASAGGRAKVWGFIQPEYQGTSGTTLAAGPWAGQDAVFNQIRPNLNNDTSFNVLHMYMGVRGTTMPIDPNVNYFVMFNGGNNPQTNGIGGGATMTDASITLNHIKGARIRIGQFKYPGSEEGQQALHATDYINFSNAVNGLLLERNFQGDGSDTTSANKPVGSIGGFRDTGIQVFDMFKSGKWEHSYAVMAGNGTGMNGPDPDGHKDVYLYWSSEKVFKGKKARREHMKFYVWNQDGKRLLPNTGGETIYDRTRTGLGMTYRKGKNRAAFEYITADGMIFNGTDGGAVPGSSNNAGTATASWNVATTGKANGYYIDYGFMVTPKWELDIRHDVYNRLTDNTNGERIFTTTTLGAQYLINKKTRLKINFESRDAEAPAYTSTQPPNAILGSMDDRISAAITMIY